jgi:hypothetical protein
VTSRRLVFGLVALVPLALLGLLLTVWFVPSGPSIGGTVGTTGFHRGYVRNHYSVWSAFGIRHPFVVTDAQVVVTGAGCQGQVRLVGSPVVGGYLAGVSTGPLPGAAVIGRRLTPQMGPRLALVVTASTTGRCHVREIRFASHSWWRSRWTTVPGGFSVNVTHSTGVDPRTNEASPPAL